MEYSGETNGAKAELARQVRQTRATEIASTALEGLMRSDVGLFRFVHIVEIYRVGLPCLNRGRDWYNLSKCLG